MRVAVEFQDERVDIDVPEGRLVLAWQGPAGHAAAEVPGLVAGALEGPREFPPLRTAIVPGDQVVVAFGADVPEPAAVLAAVCRVLEAAGVETDAVTVLADPEAPESLAGAVPEGVTFKRHDPEDRDNLAYLATTTDGRRVYLNRLLTDADFVLPVGRIAYDSVLGYQGPWGVIYPALSDTETRQAFRARVSDEPPDRGHPAAPLAESTEVSWLLGCQFQVGLVSGVSGVSGVVAGLGSAVFDQGTRETDEAWGIHTSSRAELVIAGVGRPGVPTEVGDVARGLATATRLVQRGGKIVVLSKAAGAVGPAVRRLANVDDPRGAASRLKGHETEGDYPAARQLARALAWADVYLLSDLDPDTVEELSMVALERPEEARRLAAVSGSTLVVSRADLARAFVDGETD